MIRRHRCNALALTKNSSVSFKYLYRKRTSHVSFTHLFVYPNIAFCCYSFLEGQLLKPTSCFADVNFQCSSDTNLVRNKHFSAKYRPSVGLKQPLGGSIRFLKDHFFDVNDIFLRRTTFL
eukprot:TRINITY_DN10314_c0_g1_i1.p1 TRINITY_DN10314_c0_g1~~TRINITY_DN10314_c0_g1_i1.p1  ORF type:complete len:120 (-),score=9.68 TRINITY_DN10314_c0_g1_i1:111-470(-)